MSNVFLQLMIFLLGPLLSMCHKTGLMSVQTNKKIVKHGYATGKRGT